LKFAADFFHPNLLKERICAERLRIWPTIGNAVKSLAVAVGELSFVKEPPNGWGYGVCDMAESINAESINPAATHHLPSFITAPGQTDVLMAIAAIVLLLSIVAFGVLFLRLHTLPERLAHKSQKIQFEIVAVLGLLALFTHIHAFWVAGLLLALIEVPDLGSFLGRIAGSVEKIAGVKPPEETSELYSSEATTGERVHQPHERASKADNQPASSKRSESAPIRAKEASHA
jgi:hypothetical protein